MLTLADTDKSRLFILIGVMVGVIFLATVAIMIFRKKILSSDKASSSGSMMDDFRRLHASGQLSDEEFQSLRTRMAARMKGEVLPRATPPQSNAPAPRPPAAAPRQIRSENPPKRPQGPTPPTA